MRNRISLNGSWNLYYSPDRKTNIKLPTESEEVLKTKIRAEVPCNVEMALAEAGIIEKELYKGMATEKNMKFEDYHWWFEKEFEYPNQLSDERVYLSFGMVDCFADYYLNGELVHQSKNAYCEIKFDITNKIKLNEKNLLQVHIRPVMPYILSQKTPHGMIRWNVGYGTFVRKPAHSFGWDIMPRAVSAGIYRDVNIITEKSSKINDVSFDVLSVNEKIARIRVFATIDLPYEDYKKKVEIRFKGRCEESHFDDIKSCFHFNNCIHIITIKNPRLWWPYGYGDANVYDVECELLVNDEVRDVCYETLGVRTVKLERTESLSEKNSCFQFYINDVPIMCKGSNWVPVDAYHSRDKQRYKKALKLVSDSGCNILRVWGGGVYEQEEFYDYCDRHGVMIWQDFMMACYPSIMTEEHMKNLGDEIEWAVKKLRNHPSIILWAGDNEVDQCSSAFNQKPSDNKITRQLIPDILAMNDKTRPYIPSSPYVPDNCSRECASGERPLVEDHTWGSRDFYKSDYYTQTKACFVSEVGYHGCPSVDSLKKMVDEDKIWPIYNEQWYLHSSNQVGELARVKLMEEQISQMFGFKADNIEDFVVASQISQAEAKKFFIESIRVKKPKTSGIMWWNLLDGWPQMSDAVVDYFHNKKLAYYYIKRSQAPFALMMGELENWNYHLYAENDTRENVSGTYSVFDIDTNETLAEGEFSVRPNTGEHLCGVRLYYSEQRFLVIKWTIDDKDYYNHYQCGRPPFNFAKYKECLAKYKKILNYMN